MSHYVGIEIFDYCNGSEKQKKAIQQHCDNIATRKGDGQIGLDKNIQWLDKEFDYYGDAHDYLENHDGFYWQGAVKFKKYESMSNPKSERIQKKIDDLNLKLAKTKADLKTYVEKNNVKNRKSVYVGCSNCGSKLHKDYVPIQLYSQNCPLCHTNLFSETTRNRIKSYISQIADLDKQVEQAHKELEKAKKLGKFKWMWAVKYEFHC